MTNSTEEPPEPSLGLRIADAARAGRLIEGALREVQEAGWTVHLDPDRHGIAFAWAGPLPPRFPVALPLAAELLMEREDEVANYLGAGRPARLSPPGEALVAGLAPVNEARRERGLDPISEEGPGVAGETEYGAKIAAWCAGGFLLVLVLAAVGEPLWRLLAELFAW